VIAAVGLQQAFRRLDQTLATRTVPLTGMVAALVFAGQMVNFPIGLPASGHLIGGALAAVLLGPWGASVALSLVLFVQMALFSDGGKFVYGTNLLNMALVAPWSAWIVFQAIRNRFPNPRGILMAAMVAAWCSVLASAACFCLEFWLSHPSGAFPLSRIWLLMASFHSLIGVGEALITGGILSVVLIQRPDLIRGHLQVAAEKLRSVFGAGVVAALLTAAFVAPFASELPDGLEKVAQETGFDSQVAPASPIVLDDYSVPVPGTEVEDPLWGKVATALAGLLGTITVLVLGWLLSKGLPISDSAGEELHAG
jgi:cobalt/nickel transport system permease protein